MYYLRVKFYIKVSSVSSINKQSADNINSHNEMQPTQTKIIWLFKNNIIDIHTFTLQACVQEFWLINFLIYLIYFWLKKSIVQLLSIVRFMTQKSQISRLTSTKKNPNLDINFLLYCRLESFLSFLLALKCK